MRKNEEKNKRGEKEDDNAEEEEEEERLEIHTAAMYDRWASLGCTGLQFRY